MATQVQWRRGTAAQVAAFTGAVGEVVYNTTTFALHTQDGVTVGGHALGLASGGIFNNITLTGASNIFSTATIIGGTYTSPTLNTPTINNPTVTTGTFANPALTGIPTAPTPALTSNNTTVPTTTWVRQVIQLTSPINMGLAQTFPLIL